MNFPQRYRIYIDIVFLTAIAFTNENFYQHYHEKKILFFNGHLIIRANLDSINTSKYFFNFFFFEIMYKRLYYFIQQLFSVLKENFIVLFHMCVQVQLSIIHRKNDDKYRRMNEKKALIDSPLI